MNRREMIEWCKRSPDLWDILIIGGGATGLGAAVDAASRGYKTLLLEQGDFGKGTSSRSTKLIHGGLRYLKQGNLALVSEALHERGRLRRNAPHLVSPCRFFIPCCEWWEKPFYRIGLKLYDALAGKENFEPSHSLSLEEAKTEFPTLHLKNLRGGIVYTDGQFDDARLCIALAATAVDCGAAVINYMPVTRLVHDEQGQLVGVEAIDLETKTPYLLHAKAILNATGVFSDQIRKLDDPAAKPVLRPSQGVHLVLDRSFFPSSAAILVPKTKDGRVLFFIPWHRHLLVGTTDTAVDTTELEPLPMEVEIEYLLQYAGAYLSRKPKRSDILSVFAGLRPLVKAGHGESSSTLSREHSIFVSRSKLITIAGGKWTTYRRMAQDAIDEAERVAGFEKRPCSTKNLKLHGYLPGKRSLDPWTCYGTDAANLEALAERHPDLGHLLHPRLPYTPAEILWAVRQEMARTLEDALARRTRSLFLDAAASIEIAPRVAALMGQELGWSSEMQQQQTATFIALAKNYLPR